MAQRIIDDPIRVTAGYFQFFRIQSTWFQIRFKESTFDMGHFDKKIRFWSKKSEFGFQQRNTPQKYHKPSVKPLGDYSILLGGGTKAGWLVSLEGHCQRLCKTIQGYKRSLIQLLQHMAL